MYMYTYPPIDWQTKQLSVYVSLHSENNFLCCFHSRVENNIPGGIFFYFSLRHRLLGTYMKFCLVRITTEFLMPPLQYEFLLLISGKTQRLKLAGIRRLAGGLNSGNFSCKPIYKTAMLKKGKKLKNYMFFITGFIA